MDFSIIVPTYKDWGRLEKCLRHLVKMITEDFDFEIIVVDNEEKHSPPESLKKYDNLHLIHEPEPGSYAARNRGAKQASGRFLAFTDADCLPDKNWLKHALKTFNKTGCDLIGGRIEIFREKDSSRWAYIYEKNTAFPQSKNVEAGKAVTANLIVKKEVFEKLKGFNSELKSGGDWDFSKRAVKSGYSLLYDDNVIVKHPARESIRAIFKKQKRLSAWGYLNARKRFGYSGLRIVAGNFYYGLGKVFRSAKTVKKINEKTIIVLISFGLYLFKSLFQLMIVLGFLKPENIRE